MAADERYFMIYCIVYRYLLHQQNRNNNANNLNKSSKLSIIPVMLCFFCHMVVDLQVLPQLRKGRSQPQ